MRAQSIKVIFIKNMLLFLIFGIVVSALTTYLHYKMKFVEIQSQVSKDSIYVSDRIKSKIETYMDQVEGSLEAIENNKLFINYLLNSTEDSKYTTQHLFINSMKNNKNFFQFRFINDKGMEIIRVDRERETNLVFIVDEAKLQNKSDRYYFQETIKQKAGTYWHSNLDLNMERGAIEKPHRPTYRISKNIYHKGVFYGILIVNVEVQNLLNSIKLDKQFDTYLTDNNGYYILHPNDKKSWSKYLETKYTIFSDFPDLNAEAYRANNFSSNGFLFSLETYFQNTEKIKLALIIKKEFVDTLIDDNLLFALTLGLIIILVSIPIGLIISLPTSKLYMDFNRLNKENLRYMDTIDKYIPTMNVGIDNKITDVSEAFCRLSGYTESEIIGQEPSLFKSGKTDQKIYEDLWDKITNGVVWKGELEDKAKSGDSYWVDITILANYSDDNTIESYTSISENITDKKIIEKVSQTDKLT